MLTEFKLLLKQWGLEYFKRYYSSYRGFVVDNNDPEFNCRLKITCPAVFGKETFDEWVYPKGIPSGKNFGFFAPPSIGDMIWVSFENGDPAFPIWEYGHWTQAHKTPGTNNKIFVFQTPEKQRIEFDDEKGLVKITSKDGYYVEISKDGFRFQKDNIDMRTLTDSLFDAFKNTKTATSLGPQPFINIAEYEALKVKFQKLFY